MQRHTQAHTCLCQEVIRALPFKWKSMEAANLFLSAVSLHNTSKERSITSYCQGDVNLSLFMWERDASKTETIRERLEMNSACVCVCAWIQMVNFYHCSSFLWLVNPSFSMPVFSIYQLPFVTTHNARVNGHPFLINSHIPAPMILPNTAGCTAIPWNNRVQKICPQVTNCEPVKNKIASKLSRLERKDGLKKGSSSLTEMTELCLESCFVDLSTVLKTSNHARVSWLLLLHVLSYDMSEHTLGRWVTCGFDKVMTLKRMSFPPL